jgi:hypothetical protein
VRPVTGSAVRAGGEPTGSERDPLSRGEPLSRGAREPLSRAEALSRGERELLSVASKLSLLGESSAFPPPCSKLSLPPCERTEFRWRRGEGAGLGMGVPLEGETDCEGLLP